MKILFISERFPPDIGGVAASASRICANLAAMGHSVDVVSWSRHIAAGKMQIVEVAPGIRLIAIGQYRQWDMTAPTTLNIIEWLHETERYELVWGHYLFPAGFIAVWFAAQHNLISTVSARGNDLDRDVFPPGDFSRLLWTLQNATTISAVSTDMAKKISVLCRRQDVFVLHNAVDSSVFEVSNPDRATSECLRDTLGIGQDELVMGFSGELREKKGLQFLLDSLSAVRKELPACLLIIGDVRLSQKTAIQLFESEFPDDAARLIVTGHTPEPAMVANHLQICDIYLQPSLFEGMPNALLEAMSCQRLCIASDAGGIPEIIRHGENGFMLKRALLNHLSSAILEAVELDALKKSQIGINARKTVIEKFSLTHERGMLEQFLDRQTKQVTV